MDLIDHWNRRGTMDPKAQGHLNRANSDLAGRRERPLSPNWGCIDEYSQPICPSRQLCYL